MLTRVTQIVNRCMQTCNLAHTDLLMNPDRTPKTDQSVRPTLVVKIALRKQYVCIALSSQLSVTAHGMLVVFFTSTITITKMKIRPKTKTKYKLKRQ